MNKSSMVLLIILLSDFSFANELTVQAEDKSSDQSELQNQVTESPIELGYCNSAIGYCESDVQIKNLDQHKELNEIESEDKYLISTQEEKERSCLKADVNAKNIEDAVDPQCAAAFNTVMQIVPILVK